MNKIEIEKTLRKVQLRAFRRDLKKIYPNKTLNEIDELINILERGK